MQIGCLSLGNVYVAALVLTCQQAAHVGNAVLHLTAGTKGAGKAQTPLLKSPPVSLRAAPAQCAGVDVSRQETGPPSGSDPYCWQVSLNICQPNPWDQLCFCSHFILFCIERLCALYRGELRLCGIHQGQCHRLRTFPTQSASQPQIFHRQ